MRERTVPRRRASSCGRIGFRAAGFAHTGSRMTGVRHWACLQHICGQQWRHSRTSRRRDGDSVATVAGAAVRISGGDGEVVIRFCAVGGAAFVGMVGDGLAGHRQYFGRLTCVSHQKAKQHA